MDLPAEQTLDEHADVAGKAVVAFQLPLSPFTFSTSNQTDHPKEPGSRTIDMITQENHSTGWVHGPDTRGTLDIPGVPS